MASPRIASPPSRRVPFPADSAVSMIGTLFVSPARINGISAVAGYRRNDTRSSLSKIYKDLSYVWPSISPPVSRFSNESEHRSHLLVPALRLDYRSSSSPTQFPAPPLREHLFKPNRIICGLRLTRAASDFSLLPTLFPVSRRVLPFLHRGVRPACVPSPNQSLCTSIAKPSCLKMVAGMTASSSAHSSVTTIAHVPHPSTSHKSCRV